MNTCLNINSIIDGSISKEKLGKLDANVQVVDTGAIISTRNIKDIKDLDTGELIYPNGHAQATFMSDGSTVEDTLKNIFEKIYPTGSIYISTANVNPNILFGVGEWEQIKDTFLLGAGDAYSAGLTGGEAEHTLTIDESAAHAHKPKDTLLEGTDTYNAMSFQTIRDLNSSSTGRHKVKQYNETTDGNEYLRVMASNPFAEDYVSLQDLGSDIETETVGGGLPHNNMPPYLTVYMWKRIK